MIVDSSLWEEPDSVIKVYLTMIALKDEDHVYRGTAFGLGKRANKSEGEVLEALKVLCAPDSKRREAQAHDGRRLKAVEDGWFVFNGPKYREMVALEAKRARDRRAAKAYRERKKSGQAVSGRFMAGEGAYVKAKENGAAEEQAMRAAEEVHPLPGKGADPDNLPDDWP